MPRKMWTPLRVNPRTRPAVVSTMSFARVVTRVPDVVAAAGGAGDPEAGAQAGSVTPSAAPPTTPLARLIQARRPTTGTSVVDETCFRSDMAVSSLDIERR